MVGAVTPLGYTAGMVCCDARAPRQIHTTVDCRGVPDGDTPPLPMEMQDMTLPPDRADHPDAFETDVDWEFDLTVSSDATFVDTADRATGVLRSLAAEQRRIEQVKALAVHERDRIDRWEAQQLVAPTRRAEYLTEMLVRWWRAVEAKGGKSKSISLPSGKVGRRAGRESLQVSDVETFVGWAFISERDDLVRTSHSVAKSEVVNAGFTRLDDGTLVTADGEVVPGVALVAGDDVYYASPTAADGVEDEGGL